MKIAIIGGGAAGMVAAITAAKEGCEVTIIEKSDRIGKKILATGNGKCNLTNTDFDVDKYYCEDKEKLSRIFRVFSSWDTITFFEDAGLMIRDKGGYIYPYCEQASAVLDVLRMQLEKYHVKICTETIVQNIVREEKKKGFTLTEKTGKKYFFDKVILACGSLASIKKAEGKNGYDLAKGFGHHIKKLMPGLCGLRSDEEFVKALAGVRAQGKVTLYGDGILLAEEKGEIQFTDYGISGIPVFQISRVAAYAHEKKQDLIVKVDFFPELDDKTYEFMNRLRYERNSEKTLENYMTGILNKKINMVLIKLAGCKPSVKACDAGYQKVAKIMVLCKGLTIHIKEPGYMENAQVCAGGVDFEEVTTELESKLVEGLFFAGEMLDVDGKCGGYNLQWAWSSGYVAGKNAAGSSTKEFAYAPEGTEGC